MMFFAVRVFHPLTWPFFEKLTLIARKLSLTVVVVWATDTVNYRNKRTAIVLWDISTAQLPPVLAVSVNMMNNTLNPEENN